MPITQVITALPPAPDTAVPATFAVLAQNFAVALPAFGAEQNTMASQMNTLAAGINAAVSGSAFDIDYTFSTTTADADPGNGFLRLNNPTQNLATAIYADLLDRLGVDWTSGLNVLDDSTSTIKGYLMLRKADDGTKWILFSVTSMTSPAGYRSLVVAVVASSAANPFVNGDFVTLGFVRTGDKGDIGPVGPVNEAQVQNQTHTAFTTGGTLTAYTLTPVPAIPGYAAGQSFFVTFHASSGAAPTLQISGIATPPNLVKQLGDGTFANIAAGEIPINHRSRVTLLSATQALVEELPFAVAGPNNTQLAGHRNKIINGNFGVNQRGVASASTAYAAGAYTLDRWKAGAGGVTLSFSTTANVTTIDITAGTLVQVIEGNNLQSGTHVLSWGGTAQGRIDAGAYGASGLTGAATGGANLTVEFGIGTLKLVQLEPGTVRTPFEHRLHGAELGMCQRYYERSRIYLIGRSTGTNHRFPWPYIVEKRASPVISLFSTTIAFEEMQVANRGVTAAVLGIGSGDPKQSIIEFSGTASNGAVAAGAILQLNSEGAFVASAEL